MCFTQRCKLLKQNLARFGRGETATVQFWRWTLFGFEYIQLFQGMPFNSNTKYRHQPIIRTSRSRKIFPNCWTIRIIHLWPELASKETVVDSSQSHLKKQCAISSSDMRKHISRYLCQCCIVSINSSKHIGSPANQSSCHAIPDIRNIIIVRLSHW